MNDEDGHPQRRLATGLRAGRYLDSLKQVVPGLSELKPADRAATTAIILNLCEDDRWVHYSRASDHYTARRRGYCSNLYTLAKVRAAFDFLERRDLIRHRISNPGTHNVVQSSACAKPSLREMVRIVVTGEPYPWMFPYRLLELRDEDRKIVPYDDRTVPRYLKRQAERLALWNGEYMNAGITGTPIAPHRKVFNRTWERGGRPYAWGPSHQNIKREARPGIAFRGEESAEEDYDEMHITMVYIRDGLALPDEPYRIGQWARKTVKYGVNIGLNARNESAWRWALAWNEKAMAAAEATPGTEYAQSIAASVVKAIKIKHADVAHAFGSDVGATMMWRDSNMAHRTMWSMLRDHGTVALPLGDSFVVPVSKRTALADVMAESADREGFGGLRISSK